eukprot:CAMPEP_0118639078 /NCGR_PEP_ID=MMETSP0785-20121206/4034_1 /TAXON_ID=91992 /ORGANISM="Bolidomonas pacifica, Strain CCMP 1866" /LENGTH=131 /DNA_ID=CAMNT_0006530387 /DNA_START=431 /DNA_END=827 /DNA_ORIENTATION=-
MVVNHVASSQAQKAKYWPHDGEVPTHAAIALGVSEIVATPASPELKAEEEVDVVVKDVNGFSTGGGGIEFISSIGRVNTTEIEALMRRRVIARLMYVMSGFCLDNPIGVNTNTVIASTKTQNAPVYERRRT